MSQTKNEMSEKSDANNNYETKRKSSNLKVKIVKDQESYICQSLKKKEVKSLYHIILTFTVYFTFANIFYYYSKPEAIKYELDFLKYSFGDYKILVIFHFLLTFIILNIIRPLTIFWLRTRPQEKTDLLYSIDVFFATIILSIYFLIFGLKIYFIYKYEIAPVMIFAICIEVVRLSMKSHGYIVESFYKQMEATEKGNKKAGFGTFEQLLYYLYAPTFIYRDEYPRLEKRNYKLIAKMILQFFFGLYVLNVMYLRLVEPIFSKVGTGPIDGLKFIQDLFTIFLASAACNLVAFYCFLHLYLNIAAQIFRFADRVFYEDWWCSTEFTAYIRKWNILVHDWIHAYAYRPLVFMISNRILAGFIIIVLSSLAHEYILILTTGYVNPILTFLFSGVGAVFYIFTKLSKKVRAVNEKKTLKHTDSNTKEQQSNQRKDLDTNSFDFTFNNTFVLFSIFVGWFLMITFYNMGYYMRKNCLGGNTIFTTYSLECMNLKF